MIHNIENEHETQIFHSIGRDLEQAVKSNLKAYWDHTSQLLYSNSVGSHTVARVRVQSLATLVTKSLTNLSRLD